MGEWIAAQAPGRCRLMHSWVSTSPAHSLSLGSEDVSQGDSSVVELGPPDSAVGRGESVQWPLVPLAGFLQVSASRVRETRDSSEMRFLTCKPSQIQTSTLGKIWLPSCQPVWVALQSQTSAGQVQSRCLLASLGWGWQGWW